MAKFLVINVQGSEESMAKILVNDDIFKELYLKEDDNKISSF